MTTNHFEFAPARKMMADLLQTADRCRLERMAQIDRALPGMRETLKRAEDTVRTCPAEIAKLEAERDALSELTPEAAVREMLPEVPAQEGPPPGPPSVKDFDPTRHEGGTDGVLCLHFAWIPLEFFAHHTIWETPTGTKMGSAGVLALAAREWRPVGATWAEVKAKSQPAEEPFVPGLPPEELRRVWPEWDVAENGHMIGCVKFAGDGTSRWQGSRDWWTVDEKSAIWIGRSFRPHGATRAHVESLAQQAQPAPPALLDLRTVRMDSEHAKPDTLIADADLYDTGRNPIEHHASVERGEKFTVERVAADHGHGPRVKVLLDGGSGVFIAAMQPAHIKPEQDKPAGVVKHACPRCDEGMREIIIEWDQDSVQTATRLGADGTAIVEIGSESTIYTPNAYRFVRADVPPPSEWCDGKGVG